MSKLARTPVSVELLCWFVCPIQLYCFCQIGGNPSYGKGKIIPHGVYDLGKNKAHVNLGTSRDTTEFACDSVAHWWQTQGRHDHPQATQLLILCDGGGSNPAGSLLFQQDVQTLANRMGVVLRVAHYPPYCSKHNPIEHRVFPHITRACEGVVLRAYRWSGN